MMQPETKYSGETESKKISSFVFYDVLKMDEVSSVLREEKLIISKMSRLSRAKRDEVLARCAAHDYYANDLLEIKRNDVCNSCENKKELEIHEEKNIATTPKGAWKCFMCVHLEYKPIGVTND